MSAAISRIPQLNLELIRKTTICQHIMESVYNIQPLNLNSIAIRDWMRRKLRLSPAILQNTPCSNLIRHAPRQ